MHASVFFLKTYLGQTGLEGFGRCARNTDRITEHQAGAGGQAGRRAVGGDLGVEERERRCWSLAGEKYHKGDPYKLWSGACCLGDGGGEQALGGSCGGLERGSGVAGGGNCQLWPKHGNFFIMSGSRRWYVIGEYMPLNNAPDFY